MTAKDKTKAQLLKELKALRHQFDALKESQVHYRKYEKELLRLSSFPEQNPHLIIETDYAGKITYLNQEVKQQFPNLEKAGLKHPFLKDIKSIIRKLKKEDQEFYRREIRVKNRIF